MSNKEEAKLKEPCQLCMRGPSIDKCRYGGHCKENNYVLFIELKHQEAAEDRIDVIGQNGNDGLHYDATQTDGLQALSSKLIQRLAADDSKVELKRSQEKQAKAKVAVSDGSTASYYQLPAGATELQQLISHRDMNAQIGEIFRACYRYGIASHSDKLRDAKKIKFYAEAEIARLEKLEMERRNGN
jgi:hypothetical protein